MIKLSLLFALAFITLIIANEEIKATKMILQTINKIQNTWKAGHNPISKKGVNYVKSLLGAKFEERNKNIIPKNIFKVSNNNIPTSFDARRKWPRCDSISSIKNQGNCGSCWAVSVASAASDRLCIATNYKTRVNISAENLMTCSETEGCDGGYTSKAWYYLQKQGLVTGGDYGSNEGCQPYLIPPTNQDKAELVTPRCSKKCLNSKFGVSYNNDKHYSKSSYYLPIDVATIQKDILKNGPVVAIYAVYEDFMYYESGVYTRTSNSYLGKHAVRIIGWGQENGVNHWLVANSWGREWGEDGTFKIKRGSNECQIESSITAGLLQD